MIPSSAPTEAAGTIAGEFRFTPRDFRRIVKMLYDDAGITLGDSKAPLVYSRLVKRLRALGLESFSRYCALVSGPEGADERVRMTAALTTNVTRFFREAHHFEHLAREVLPSLLRQAQDGNRVRIWSAGCSTGEEPYSIALTILSLLPDAADLDVRVLATDINPLVLAQGREGVYDEASLEPVSRQMRADWFKPHRMPDGGRAWAVGDALARLVSFRELNLMRPWPMTASYQAIFCRNVVIYFEPKARPDIWRRMGALMPPGGRLYVGHSERASDGAGLFDFEAATTYRRTARAAGRSGSDA